MLAVENAGLGYWRETWCVCARFNDSWFIMVSGRIISDIALHLQIACRVHSILISSAHDDQAVVYF